MSLTKGYVYLCGAGCGEYDLITLRGMDVLKKCSCVIYDALIDERLLSFAPENSEKICVGKRAGKHSENQENINDIIVKKALEGECVVRLKGGDPLVFGRGGEEAAALEKNGITYEFIPGITSSVAVPELAGIPVTHRGVSRSFHVITGHTAEDSLPDNMAEYARLNGTLVFLMGLKNLAAIADGLMNNGKSSHTPAAVISNGGRKEQSVIRGTLSDIADKAVNAPAPAVIVVGKTAEYDFLCRKRKTVSLVGTEHFTKKLSDRLTRFGIKTEYPCRLEVMEYAENTDLDNALNDLSEFTVIAFTSANGVKIFFDRMKKSHTDIRKLSHIKFAAIGRGTAETLSQYGIYADIIPEKYTAAELGRILAVKCGNDDNILIPRARQGSEELTQPLESRKIKYSDIRIYDVVLPDDTAPCEVKTEYIVFGSGSGVRCFFDSGFSLSENTVPVCIGEVTSHELKKHYSGNYLVSDSCDIYSIAEIITGE